MKIFLDSIIFGLQRFGGISNYWNHLVKGILSSDLETHLIVPRGSRNRLPPLTESNSIFIRESIFHAKLGQFLPDFYAGRSDVFHSSYYTRPVSRKARYILTAYDCIYERYRAGTAKAWHVIQKSYCLARADHVIAISETTKCDLINFYPHLEHSSVTVIPLGVDTQLFFPDPSDEENFLSDVVVFVGQRNHYKRFDIAVDSLRAFSGKLRLGIVGPSLSADEIIFLRDKLGDRWIYLGFLNENGLRKVYSNCFAFIFPSDWEGFGLPLLEAMACGCPVVSSRGGSLFEIGGQAAMFADRQDTSYYCHALYQLHDASTRDRFSRIGKERVLDFSWASTIEKTVQLYTA